MGRSQGSASPATRSPFRLATTCTSGWLRVISQPSRPRPPTRRCSGAAASASSKLIRPNRLPPPEPTPGHRPTPKPYSAREPCCPEQASYHRGASCARRTWRKEETRRRRGRGGGWRRQRAGGGGTGGGAGGGTDAPQLELRGRRERGECRREHAAGSRAS